MTGETNPGSTPPVPPATPPEPTLPEPSDRTFTQADVDRIVADRLTRERGKFADYDDLKGKAAKLDELEQAQKTEAQKLQDQVAEAQRQAALAQAERDGAIIRNAVLLEAGKQGVPQDRLEAALRLTDHNMLSIGDDGSVAGTEEAVKAMLAANPFLLAGKPNAPGLDGGAGGKQPPGGKATLSQEEEVMAQRMGLTPEQYLASKGTRRPTLTKDEKDRAKKMGLEIES